MREQVDRLTRLATDLLDLSRLDAGRLAVGREQVDLSELAGDVVRGARTRGAAPAEHVLETAVERSGPRAAATRRGCVQIGRILVENALVHTPPGSTVRVSTALDGGRATLTVADDGPGIPAGRAPAGLRAVLPAGRHPGLRQRPRSRDRARAGRG